MNQHYTFKNENSTLIVFKQEINYQLSSDFDFNYFNYAQSPTLLFEKYFKLIKKAKYNEHHRRLLFKQSEILNLKGVLDLIGKIESCYRENFEKNPELFV